MSTPVSRTNIWLYVYIAVAVVLVLSITLFWRNEQQKLEVQNLEHSLYNAQLEARVLQAEKIFGTPFIVPFSAVDRHGEPAAMPDLGKGHVVFLFFESWHHPGNLDMLSTFGSVIGSLLSAYSRHSRPKRSRRLWRDSGTTSRCIWPSILPSICHILPTAC
ncbi:MAG: hypothetical protein F4014_05455 [Gemmatimonadetes bacterium]|nr:hypothetical protein [Gemmatimonadota bacterium]